MVPARNKVKRLSSVNHTTKTIYQFIEGTICIHKKGPVREKSNFLNKGCSAFQKFVELWPKRGFLGKFHSSGFYLVIVPYHAARFERNP